MELALNIFALLVGILLHFAKRRWKGQTTADVIGYFHSHFVDTLVVLASSAVLFIVAYQTGNLSFLSAVTIGFSCDSAFNKAVGDTDRPQEGT